MIVAAVLVACDRDRPGGADGTPGSFTVDADCEAPGTVCRWLGIPGSGGYSGERTNRSDSASTGTLLFLPMDLAFADGTAYYADHNNHRIRRVGTDGLVTTISGTGLIGDGPNLPGSVTDCWEGCSALDSAWNHPTAVAIRDDDATSLWVAARDNGRVNLVDLSHETMFWWTANLSQPTSVAVTEDGTLFVSETGAGVILRITPEGLVEPIAGAPSVTEPYGLTLDGDVLWFADAGAAMIRTINVADCVSDASACVVHDTSEVGAFARPTDVAIGPAGDVYVTDTELDCVRILKPDGTVDPFAGVCTEHGYAGDGGPATEALFEDPYGVAVDHAGHVYVADSGNHLIRRIVPLR